MVEIKFEDMKVREFGIDWPNIEVEIDGDLKVIRIMEVI